jgi:hypothetical protein
MRIPGGLLAVTVLSTWACQARAPLRPDPPFPPDPPLRADSPAPASAPLRPDPPPRTAPPLRPDSPAPASAPLADDGRTAWEEWIAAARMLAPAPPKSALNVLGTLLHDRMTAEEERAPLATARTLLQENQRALQRTTAAAELTRCRFPPATPRAARDRAVLQVQALAHLMLLRAVVAARSGDLAAAVGDVDRTFAMARLLLGCQGTLAQVGGAQGIYELALRVGRWLGRRPMDDRSRAVLTTALETHAVGDAPVWAALQAAGQRSLKDVEVPEFQSAVAQADLLLAHALQRQLHVELAKVVDAALADLLGQAKLPPPERQAAEALRAKLGGPRVRTTKKSKVVLGELLQSHSRRFAVKETRARLQAGLDAIVALARARAAGWEKAIAEVGSAALGELRREPAPALAVCVFPGYFRDGIPGPVKQAFVGADNVIGHYLVATTLHRLAGSVVAELARAQELEAQRAVLVTALALLRYEARRGALPGNLAALTGAGLLKRVPTDPHTGAALHYRPTARRVWSLGADRKDNGGSFQDTVFRLPPRGK